MNVSLCIAVGRDPRLVQRSRTDVLQPFFFLLSLLTALMSDSHLYVTVFLLLVCSSTCSAARLPDWRSITRLFDRSRLDLDQAMSSILTGSPGSSGLVEGWVVWDGSQLSFSDHHPESSTGPAPAYANYSRYSQHASGFGQLRVQTSSKFSNSIQMRAAGFVEGFLTAPQIADHWHNQQAWLLSKTQQVDKVYDWLMQHYKWLTGQLDKHANRQDPFWQAMSLVVNQLLGMLQGYNTRAGTVEGQQLGLHHISLHEWLALNTMGDMDDLLELLFPDDNELSFKQLHTQDPATITSRLATRGRCSVLVKVTPDLSDLLVGHTTWWTYTAMTRIYKHYSFALLGSQIKAHMTSMSSYPGMVTSMDDWYVLDSHLVVTETSNSVLDSRVWEAVVPQSALSWQRVLVANWLSSNGADWAHWVKQHNSGTYNNQYVIVDLNKFRPGSELQSGLLTIVEQMPGLVMSGDLTQALERNYWPSYNIPYFPEVYNKSGYPQFTAKLRAHHAADASAYANVMNSLSYQLAPRAKISRRDEGSVSDLASLKAYMRSNSFRSDPFSGGSAFGAICGRGDVDPAKPRASGCNDAKVTSYKLAMVNAAEAVNGPTLGSDGSLAPFSWVGQWEGTAHKGMPATFDFVFELQKP